MAAAVAASTPAIGASASASTSPARPPFGTLAGEGDRKACLEVLAQRGDSVSLVAGPEVCYSKAQGPHLHHQPPSEPPHQHPKHVVTAAWRGTLFRVYSQAMCMTLPCNKLCTVC